jgi:hypothetical protein
MKLWKEALFKRLLRFYWTKVTDYLLMGQGCQILQQTWTILLGKCCFPSVPASSFYSLCFYTYILLFVLCFLILPSFFCLSFHSSTLPAPSMSLSPRCTLGKGKGKVSPVLWTEHHAMKAYWGSGGIAPRTFDFGTRWRWVVSFTPRPLYPQGKTFLYPLDRRLGGPQSRSGRGGEEKNSKFPSGMET